MVSSFLFNIDRVNGFSLGLLVDNRIKKYPPDVHSLNFDSESSLVMSPKNHGCFMVSSIVFITFLSNAPNQSNNVPNRSKETNAVWSSFSSRISFFQTFVL